MMPVPKDQSTLADLAHIDKDFSAVWFLCLNTVPDTSGSVVSLYGQSLVSVCPTAGMSIPTQFHRLHPSAPPACRSGRYGSSRCVVPDYRSGLSAPVVRSCSDLYRYIGWWGDSSRFPESFLSRPTGSGCGYMAFRHGPAGVFQFAGRGHRNRII